MTDERRQVWIDYTNYKGERAWRLISPISIQFQASEWHPDTQWILHAEDCDKRAVRGFALKDIHAWRIDEPPLPAPTDPRDAELTRLREENERLTKENARITQSRNESDNARSELTRQLAEAKAREIKVRWESRHAYVGPVLVGHISEYMAKPNWYWRLHIEPQTCGEVFDEQTARTALESAALSALCEGGK